MPQRFQKFQILFEILENQKWKGRKSSCRPSQPNCQIGLARPAGACTALPCLIFQDFKQNMFGILEAYLFILRSQFCCTFQLYQIPDQRTVSWHQMMKNEKVETNDIKIHCASQESNKVERYSTLTAQDKQVSLKDSKYILFEILENQTWKGRTSSCWPSKPDLVIWLAIRPSVSGA